MGKSLPNKSVGALQLEATHPRDSSKTSHSKLWLLHPADGWSVLVHLPARWAQRTGDDGHWRAWVKVRFVSKQPSCLVQRLGQASKSCKQTNSRACRESVFQQSCSVSRLPHSSCFPDQESVAFNTQAARKSRGELLQSCMRKEEWFLP